MENPSGGSLHILHREHRFSQPTWHQFLNACSSVGFISDFQLPSLCVKIIGLPSTCMVLEESCMKRQKETAR